MPVRTHNRIDPAGEPLATCTRFLAPPPPPLPLTGDTRRPFLPGRVSRTTGDSRTTRPVSGQPGAQRRRARILPSFAAPYATGPGTRGAPVPSPGSSSLPWAPYWPSVGGPSGAADAASSVTSTAAARPHWRRVPAPLSSKRGRGPTSPRPSARAGPVTTARPGGGTGSDTVRTPWTPSLLCW